MEKPIGSISNGGCGGENGGSDGCTNGGGGGGGGENHCITSFVDTGSVESHRYYLARRTVLEMLRDRGYVVPNSELTRSLSEFRSVFEKNPDLARLRICTNLRSNPSKKILVIFCGTEEIRKQVMVGILNQISNKESLYCLMLVLQSKLNCHARKVLDEFPAKVETFHITELLVNITNHVLQPKHEILNSQEKQKVLKKYNAEEKQIPRLLESDALARYYGLERGQVVKFTHNGSITDSVVTYRCVT